MCKRFVTRTKLNHHINTHTGDKPFKCPNPGRNNLTVCAASRIYMRMCTGLRAQPLRNPTHNGTSRSITPIQNSVFSKRLWIRSMCNHIKPSPVASRWSFPAQAVLRIRNVYTRSWLFSIPDLVSPPTQQQQQKSRGKRFVKKMCCPIFFVATIITELLIILFLNWQRIKYEPIYQEL